MKNIVKSMVFFALMSAPLANAGFIHPMDFDGSEGQKAEVIQFIKSQVKKEYCSGAINMCQAMTLRMMEQQNLNAFKQATVATNRKIMDRVIQDYCHGPINMCNYQTIMMMYQQNLDASKQQLNW
ncbi:hypothetical protein [Oceanobacter sp. 4_MG-2023]|uniref:hypothetical protein n=1 Tax=Oceanobacter sp. 4_MG-2023 TaxID=3062623 RepID=UPI002735030E|nr:hypothetical protein [Oceanobacter sp. 4_MG-2023]MDP2548873.1 hypothetical protein [Oceanobacter sp. 4_MG-2023]